MGTVNIHWEILNKERQKLLPVFREWQKDGFYLAGGTALALQIGHRTSLDFDFYVDHPFDPLTQVQKLSTPAKKIKVTTQKQDTLLAVVNNIQVSAFFYPYKKLKPLIKTEYMSLASLEDIAAMKLLAIAQRGKKRDFIDMFFLCQRFSLRDIIGFCEKKFPSFDPYNGLRGLIYFDEAEKETPRFALSYKKRINWLEIKEFFLKTAQKHMRRGT